MYGYTYTHSSQFLLLRLRDQLFIFETIKLWDKPAFSSMFHITDLKSPLLFTTLSGGQYWAELSNTTISTVLVLFPRLV